MRLFIGAAMLAGMAIWCLTDLRATPKDWSFDSINEIAGYLLNNWGPVVFFPAALLLALRAVMFLRRTLVADQEGIGYVGKDKLAWGDVRSVDTLRFDKKGVLALLYQRDGQDKRLVLDGWKLQNFKDLLKLVETKLTI